MQAEADFGWVPDILPKFERRIISLTIDNPRLIIEILGYAYYFNREPIDLFSRFIKKALEVEGAANNPRSEVVEKDVWGRTSTIRFMDQEYYPPNHEIVPYRRVLAGNISSFISIPSESVDEMMEMANRNNTTMEKVLEKMYVFGLKLARAEVNPEKSYIVRTGNQERRISLFY